MLLNWGLTPPCPPDSAGDSKVGTLCCKADRSLVNKTGHLDLLATVPRCVRTQTAAKSDLRTNASRTGCDLPRAGSAKGVPNYRRTPDAGPCAHVHRDPP